MPKQLSSEYLEYVRLNEIHKAACELATDDMTQSIADVAGDAAWKALETVCDRPVRTVADVFEIGEVVRSRLLSDDGTPHSTNNYLEGALFNAVRALAEIEEIALPATV